MLANNALVKDRHDCVVKGLLFLYHYINLRQEHAKRLKTSSSATNSTTTTETEQPVDINTSSSSSDVEFISELGLRQETHYNLGTVLLRMYVYMDVCTYQLSQHLLLQYCIRESLSRGQVEPFSSGPIQTRT